MMRNVALGLGHNNDQGMFGSITYLREFIEEHQIYLLVDGGYHHHKLIGPANVPPSLEQQQKDERSSVEKMIGLAKTYGFASDVVRHNPELHEVGLIVVYELTHLKCMD